MCDVYSLGSMASDILGGMARSQDARGRAGFEQSQILTMAISAGTDAKRETSRMIRSYGEELEDNIAAISMSNLSPESFAPLLKGNEKRRQKNIEILSDKAKAEGRRATFQAAEREIVGRLEARAGLYSGLMSAVNAGVDAEDRYQEVNTGQSRWEFFKESARGRSFYKSKF